MEDSASEFQVGTLEGFVDSGPRAAQGRRPRAARRPESTKPEMKLYLA